MRRLTTILVAALLAGAAGADELARTTIAGEWRLVDEDTGALRSIVRMEILQGIAQARVVSVHDADSSDPICERCSGRLAGHPMVGLPIVTGLELDAGRWRGGKILDPQSGRLYDCVAHLADEGSTLVLRGYLGVPAFGRTVRWRRHEAM